MTVEGRERYPVRVRYARAFRDDVEGLRRVLVTASGGGMSAAGAGSGGMGETPAPQPTASRPVQVPLAELADVRVVEGPSMIKGENGLLRSYIQLNVRGRDEVGFVEEARRVVQEKVKLPRRDVPGVVGDVRAPGPGPEDAPGGLPGGDRR